MRDISRIGNVNSGRAVVVLTPLSEKPLEKGRGTVPMTPVPKKTPTAPPPKKG